MLERSLNNNNQHLQLESSEAQYTQTMSSQEWPRYQQALDSFLESSQGNLTPASSSRVAKAREKLKKLTKIQFSDLSTDVYDEMQRREATRMDPENLSLPKYLASQPNYHPKRNQARQKLAALPPSRFKDLVNDVLFEIGNRMHKEEKVVSNADTKVVVERGYLDATHPVNLKNDIDNNINDARLNTHFDSQAQSSGNGQPNSLQIDVGKTKQFNDDFFSDLKTPQTSDFLGTNMNPSTPSQREIKPTTLVPKKSELTWSSDEDDDVDDHHDNNRVRNESVNASEALDKNLESNNYGGSATDPRTTDGTHKSSSVLEKDSPLKTHSLQHIDPTSQNESSDTTALKNELQELKFKIDELELENSHLKSLASEQREMNSENENLKTQIETLSRNHMETNNHLKSLTNQYADYDELRQELHDTKGQLSAQSEELDSLRQMTDIGHEKQLSVEDSREFDTLKTYLDKVLEENEELKSKLASRATSAQNDERLKEYESLRKQHDDLIQSHRSLNENYKSLRTQSDDLSSKLEKQQALTASASKSKSGSTTIKANTSAVLDWQNKFESLRASQIQSKLSSLTVLPKFTDKKVFSPTGYISIESISKVNASLETILIYMDSKDDSAESLVDPSVLFERVANFVSNANVLSKEVNISSSDRNFVRIEEKKRILKNAISNALSTTKHFALYRHILPSLVLNAALNDVYFSICSLISLAKIRGDGSKGIPETQSEYLEDNATITATPIALKKISEIEETSPSYDSNHAANNTETSVRPLRITQRLASGSALDLNDFSKPGQPSGSRSGSPIGRKILSSPILPIIATGKKTGDFDNAKLAPNTKRNVTRNGSVENIKDSVIKPDLSLAVGDEPLLENSTKNGSKVSVSSLASKFSSPEHESSNGVNVSKGSITSPSRGKNIVDKLKKFDTSSDDVRTVGNGRSSPGSSKVMVGHGVAKAFDKFGAKRRSVDLSSDAASKDAFTEGAKENNVDSPERLHSRESVKDANNVLLNKDLNTVNDNAARNPFIEGPANIKKGGLFGAEEQTEMPLKIKAKELTPSDRKTGDSGKDDENVLNLVASAKGDTAKDTLDDATASLKVKTNTSDLKLSDGKQVQSEGSASTITSALNKSSINLTGQNDDAETFDGDQYFNAPDYNSNKLGESSQSNPISKKGLPELNLQSSSSFKNEIDSFKTRPSMKLSTETISKDKTEDYDDFNNYEGDHKSGSGVADPLPSAGSALDIDENLVRRVSKRQSFRKSVLGNNQSSQRTENNKEGWNYNGESEEDEEEEFDVDKFNTLNPDNTLRELLLYLEHQTVEVIGAIQKTLQSIRDPKATKGLLRGGTAEINSVVKQMAEGTSTLMNQSRYSESMGHAKYVVGVLEDCVQRMEALYGQDTSHDGEYAGKNFKQRSAGIAFDVARSTKELVKTVEEASLRDEIAVLDSRLRRD